MRKIVEILRLAREGGWSIRRIAASVGAPHSTVGDYLRRFEATGLPWPLPPDVDQAALETRLFARTSSKAVTRPLPDWPTVHQELQRKGVTLELLWQEYKRTGDRRLKPNQRLGSDRDRDRRPGLGQSAFRRTRHHQAQLVGLQIPDAEPAHL